MKVRRSRASYANGTRANPLRCSSWEEAFDACRERDRPLVAEVGGEVTKIFPSGSYEEVARLTDPPVIVMMPTADAVEVKP